MKVVSSFRETIFSTRPRSSKFVVSNFNPTVYFGFFVSLAMIMALLGALTLLPHLLITFKPMGEEKIN